MELCIMAACANCGRDVFEVVDLGPIIELAQAGVMTEILAVHCEQCKAEALDEQRTRVFEAAMVQRHDPIGETRPEVFHRR